jgi:hypothetical protein
MFVPFTKQLGLTEDSNTQRNVAQGWRMTAMRRRHSAHRKCRKSQTILRFLFGALAEAWEMVKRPTNQKLIGKDYIDLIEVDGIALTTS